MKHLFLLAFCARLLAQTNFGAHVLDDNLVEFKEVKIEDRRKPQRSREAIAPKDTWMTLPLNDETPVKVSSKTPDCHNK